MSNLLNNQKTKKKLLDRGPRIVPEQEFKLEEPVEAKVEETISTKEMESENPTVKAQKRRNDSKITSVRVTKATRNKINALIQLGKAESVDLLIDILLDEYIENLVKEEKKTYNLVLEILQKKER